MSLPGKIVSPDWCRRSRYKTFGRCTEHIAATATRVDRKILRVSQVLMPIFISCPCIAHRRNFLAQSARLISLAAAATSVPAGAVVRSGAYPFPLNAQSVKPLPMVVHWEMAEGDGFRKIAAKSRASALPKLAHSVHIDRRSMVCSAPIRRYQPWRVLWCKMDVPELWRQA